MRRLVYILLFIGFVTGSARCQEDTAAQENRQYTRWALTIGPNLTSYRCNLQNVDDAPDKVTPALGIDCGAAIEYRISQPWSLQMGLLGNIERVGLQKDGNTSKLSDFGIDLSIQACWQSERGLLAAIGPYTHFVLGSITNDWRTPNPHSRGFADNPRTEEPLFAIGDLNAGIALTAGYELNKNWHFVLDLKWGVTDLLITDSHRLYVRPLKTALRLVYNFQ